MKLPTFLAGFACSLASCLPLSAQVLMLDFGPTIVADGSRTSSPYHSVTVGFSDTTWNRVQTADITSGLLWSNTINTPATGVSVNIGATSDATTRTINLATTPSGNLPLGSPVNTGLYSGTSVITDGIFNGSSGNTRAVGVQIGGLSAGTYDVYVSGRNTNTSATNTQNFYAGVDTSAGNFTFAETNTTTAASGYTTAAINYVNASSGATLWAQGSNYVKFSVILTSDDVLNIAALGGAGEGRGFLNMIQVVNTTPVPEPAAAAALAGLLGLGAAAFRRRRA